MWWRIAAIGCGRSRGANEQLHPHFPKDALIGLSQLPVRPPAEIRRRSMPEHEDAIHGEPRCQALEQVAHAPRLHVGIGRIGEDEAEAGGGWRFEAHRPGVRGAHAGGGRAEPQLLEIRPKRPQRLAPDFDEGARSGPARQAFDADRAAAGEEVEHVHRGQASQRLKPMAENVEEGFLDLVGYGPRVAARRREQRRASKLAGDHAHGFFVRLWRGRQRPRTDGPARRGR